MLYSPKINDLLNKNCFLMGLILLKQYSIGFFLFLGTIAINNHTLINNKTYNNTNILKILPNCFKLNYNKNKKDKLLLVFFVYLGVPSLSPLSSRSLSLSCIAYSGSIITSTFALKLPPVNTLRTVPSVPVANSIVFAVLDIV